ncbi:MAG: GAF domain-containing protein, partial [Myxococcota bacterium]
MRLRSLAAYAGRLAWRGRGAGGVALFGWLVADGVFATPSAARTFASACLGALLAERLFARLRLRGLDLRTELETALLLMVGAYAALGFAGGALGALHPIVYGCAAFIAASERMPVIGAALALALAFEARGTPALLPWHAALLAAFAAGGALLFRAELWRQRGEHRRRLDEAVRSLREEARDFRLIGTALGAGSRARSRAQEEEKLAQGSVETIHHGLYHLLELLKKSLELRTCVLLWLDDDGGASANGRLKIKEVISDSDLLAEAPFAARAGAPGAILRSRASVRLESGDVGVPYYQGPETVGAFLGVPVIEDGHVRGVLCADRREARAFSDGDEQFLRKSAEQVVLIVKTERVLGAVERSKYETERFLEASKKLASALTLEQVYDQALEAARTITHFDFAALTLA